MEKKLILCRILFSRKYRDENVNDGRNRFLFLVEESRREEVYEFLSKYFNEYLTSSSIVTMHFIINDDVDSIAASYLHKELGLNDAWFFENLTKMQFLDFNEVEPKEVKIDSEILERMAEESKEFKMNRCPDSKIPILEDLFDLYCRLV